ncbi:hypothetical protein GCM10027020_11420 [Nocardioides salsibiostraticola]
MLSVLIVIGLFVLAWPVARGASRPASRTNHRRKAERRARYVARNPHEVDLGDIRLMLRRGGLNADQIDFVATRATEMGIGPFTMLVWLKRFDAPALATVIAADLSHDTLIAHVSNGTVPDLDGLEVFAELNGFGLVPAPTKWAMENGVPVTMETLGMFDEIVPNDERPPGRDDFGAA